MERSGLLMARWFLLAHVLPVSSEKGGSGGSVMNSFFWPGIRFPEIRLGWFFHCMKQRLHKSRLFYVIDKYFENVFFFFNAFGRA